jgi:hypothetical protein
MRMKTHGDGVPRSAKLSLLISDPVAMAHLRVCWEHRNGGEFLNCGVCEKCLRTLLEIEAVQPGATARLPTFPPGSLEARLCQLKRIPDHLVPLWRDLGERQQSSPALFAQIQHLTSDERAEQRMRPRIPTRVVEGYRELRAQWSLMLG